MRVNRLGAAGWHGVVKDSLEVLYLMVCLLVYKREWIVHLLVWNSFSFSEAYFESAIEIAIENVTFTRTKPFFCC